MPETQPQRRERFREIAVDLLEKKAETECRVTPWLIAVWPWSWVQHQPFVRSFALALLSYAVLLVTNTLNLSIVFAVKFAVVAAAIFAGLYNPFLVARLFSRLFRRLRQFSLLPQDALARWYAQSVSKFIGKVNLYANPEAYRFRELWRDDRVILATSFVLILATIPSALYIAGEIPGRSLASLSRAAMIAFAGYSVAWAGHFAFCSLTFVFDLAVMPVRYHPDMPACASLKSVGTLYLQLAYLYSVTYAELLAAAYLCRVPLAGVVLLWAVVPAAILLTSVVASQIAIMAVLREQKQKRLVEYSLHIEQAFEEFMRNPKPETHTRVNELLKLGKIVKRLDTTGFSFWSLGWFLLLVVFDFGISLAYYYLARNQMWIGG